jgi:hypothetical protein
MNWPQVHEGYAPAYTLSAIPYMSSSTISLGEIHQYTLPFVSRFITVQNRGIGDTDEIAFAFTQNGFKPEFSNYNSLGQGDSYTGELRTVQLFVSCSRGSNVKYQVLFGLTDIPHRNFLLITGSNGHAGVG